MSTGNFYSEHLYQKTSRTTEELEKHASDYPFSSLASFLLLYHYKKTSNLGFEKLAKKTVLQFSNPRWLQFILHQKPGEKKVVIEKEFAIDVQKPSEFTNDIPTAIDATQIFFQEHKEENIIERKDDITPANEGDETPIVKLNIHGKDLVKDDKISEDIPEVTSLDNIVFKNTFAEKEIPTDADDVITFDPLHTVDYFASQGIKLTDEAIPNDKLGNQMKSFTSWLKSMKKLHAEKLPEQNLVTEKLIQTSAEISNINTEILTEAMAEVLIKQDKKEKAIDMFNKLSLINPAKSAYFAAKIESIKLR